VKGRGALLGPEKSGPAHWTWCLGGWIWFFWVTARPECWLGVVAGAGSHQTVGVGVLFWVGCFPGAGCSLGRWWMWGWCSCPYF